MALERKEIEYLNERARHLRRHVILMLGKAGSGHPGGSLSAADIVTALYFKVMRYKSDDPDWPDRDRFILSKGHACPILYAALGEAGFFSHDHFETLRKFGSILQGHPSKRHTPGVEIASGSLGQGLSVGLGAALGGKIDRKDYRVYVLLGDGEINEGQVWEAAMASAHYKADNLCAFLDHNRLQIDGPTDEIMCSVPLMEKWEAFGWNVIRIDGHDFNQIIDASRKAKGTKGKPTVVVASTIKGKGVSYMENQVDWHGKAPSEDLVEQALKDLS